MSLYQPSNRLSRDPIDMTRCREAVSDGRWPSWHQCFNKGTIDRDGVLFCKLHDPVVVVEKRNARRKADEERVEKARIRDRLNHAAPDLLAVVTLMIDKWHARTPAPPEDWDNCAECREHMLRPPIESPKQCLYHMALAAKAKAEGK